MTESETPRPDIFTSRRPYLIASLTLLSMNLFLILVAILVLTPAVDRFKRIFMEMEVVLPVITQDALSLSSGQYTTLAIGLGIVLLAKEFIRSKPATLAINAVGLAAIALAWGFLFLSLWLPMLQLIHGLHK